MKKRLLPEELPVPTTEEPQSDTRQRVQSRMRELVKRGVVLTGATAALASCVCCDPLPPPCVEEPDGECVDYCEGESPDPDCAEVDGGPDDDGGTSDAG